MKIGEEENCMIQVFTFPSVLIRLSCSFYIVSSSLLHRSSFIYFSFSTVTVLPFLLLLLYLPVTIPSQTVSLAGCNFSSEASLRASRGNDMTDFAVVPTDEQQPIDDRDFYDNESQSVASCIICRHSNNPENLVWVTSEKGINTLIQFSKTRSKAALLKSLLNSKATKSPVYVHAKCRRHFSWHFLRAMY